MMDTPEKTQIPTPISKFEDSPVFSYINSLSPIKQEKSIHTSQAFNSPTFASPLSVFTSPGISLHGETRFSKRNHFTGLSKYELSECGTEESKSDRVPNSVQPSDLCSEKLGLSLGNSAIEDSTKAHNEHPESVIDFPKTLKYDHNGPDSPRCDVLPTNNVLEGTPASGVQFTGDGSNEKHGSLVNEKKLGISCQIDQTKEAAGCHWKEFISDAADPLVLDSSIIDGSSERQDPQTVDSGTTSCTLTSVRLPEKDTNDLQRTELAGPTLSLGKKGMNVHVLLSSEVAKLKETEQARGILSTTSLDKQIIRDLNAEAGNNEEKNMETSCKPTFQQQRSIRRLVFEISGVHKKISALNCGSSSSVSSQPESKVYTVEEKHKVSIKPPTSSSSKLAGIGLHLNALASTSNNHSLTKHDSLASRVQLISMPSSNVSDDSLISDQKSVDMSLNLNSLDRGSGPHDNGVQVMEDATSSFGYSEGLHQSSPKKKRHKSEHAGGSEACKRCNCKKTKCLKLYCECFAAGLYCVEPCYCQDCFNRPIHENTVLETRKLIESRNPLAFAPKVIRSSESVPEFEEEYNKTPASARHRRGCNCRKSSCLKKYCECFQGGVGCSIGCRCEGCKNTFGRKYGTEEVEGKESVACETSLNNFVEKGEEEHSGPAVLPTTPSLETHRPPVNLPLSSIKPPRASLAVGSSPQLQDEFNTTPASARHKRGCNCQKSSCLKKYCECFQGGVGCSIGCRCEGCQNAFGRKYGTEDPELEGEKTVTTETLRKNVVEKVEQKNSNPDVPITPSLETHRPMAPPPLSFNMKPPHASPLRIGSSPQLRPGFKLNQSEFFSRMSKVEKRLQMTPKNETPESLKDNFSPITETRSSSPNFKTVSPPHRNYAPSPAWRSGRKLILRSIPALPSLDQREKQ